MNDLEQLKTLLFGAEKQALDSITDRVQRRESRAADVADVLPEAVRLSHRQGDELVETLREPVGECLQESFHREPERYADALYPVMGPAIRKSIMNALRAFAQQINETIEQSLSARGVKWRYEAWRSGIPFGQYVVQRTLLYRIEQAYLISRDNGLLISHVHHESSKIKDSDAVSAMFTAIQDFIKESFSPDRSGRLETADMGEFTLWAVHGPHALLVCVIRGVPPRSLRSDLSGILERVHFRYTDAIRDYAGDTSTMEGVEDELSACLRFEAMQPKDPDKKRSKLPLIIIAALLTGTLANFGFGSWKIEQQRLALQDTIAATPGWHASVIEYDDGTYHVSGLRDPLAASIADIATGAGLESEQVAAKLQPFQSLDPVIVLRRAELALSAPTGVVVVAGDGRITLSGEAPMAWIAATQQKMDSGLIPIPIELDGVIAVEIGELERQAAAFSEAQFMFSEGAILIDADAARLQQHAKQVGQLARSALAIGMTLRITVVGHTDALGAPERNRQIATARADAARSALLQQGVPSAWIDTSLVVPDDSAETAVAAERRVVIAVNLATAQDR